MRVALTIDLEDPTEVHASDGRYIALTDKILSLCEETGRKATFFTTGRVARSAPALIKRIAAQGHEVAWHSRAHIPLTETTPACFAKECAEDKDLLEQLAGKAVTGFRAPCFSLTKETLWATEILADRGFLYSSSVMPTRFSRFGLAGASSEPFLWPSGLIEFPLPVGHLGPLRIPYAGGVYLYLLPSFLSDFFLRRADRKEVIWTYAHPYDLDPKESYLPMPHTPLWVGLVLWFARQGAEAKLRHILENERAGPLQTFCSSFPRPLSSVFLKALENGDGQSQNEHGDGGH